MKGIFLLGKKVVLQPPPDHDLAKLCDWYNNGLTTRLMFTGTFPSSPSSAIEEYKQLFESSTDVVLGIYLPPKYMKTETGSIPFSPQFIGTIGLHSINWIVRSAEFRIFIGDREYWNKGLGTEATELMVDYGFNRLNLSVVWLGVNEENLAAKKVYERVGFKVDGLLRRVQYRNSRYYDAYRMSLLREEWYV